MYRNIFTLYSSNFDGLQVYSRSGSVIGINAPVINADGSIRVVEVAIPTDEPVIFTGRFFETVKGDICYQIQYGSAKAYGYVFQDQLNQFTQDVNDNPEARKVVNVLNELIENNKIILENNLLCSRIISVAQKRELTIPQTFRKQLFELQARLTERNQQMKKSGHLSKYDEAISPDFSVYNQYLIDFMKSPGIGIVITSSVAIIVAFVLSAASFAAAYGLFKILNRESKIDFQYSNDLTAKLIKYLPRDVYDEVMKENEANHKAAKRAIDQASGKGTLNTIKYLAVGYLGFFLIDKYLIKK